MVNFEIVVMEKTEKLESSLTALIDKYPHKIMSAGAVKIENVETGKSVHKMYMRGPIRAYWEAKRKFGDECLVNLGHHV